MNEGHEELISCNDCDDTLRLAHDEESIPGIDEYMAEYASSTAVISVGIEGTQLAKLEKLEKPEKGIIFRNKLIVPDGEAKARTIHGYAKIRSPSLPTLIFLGDRLDLDIRPAREAGLIAVRMRHPKGKYSWMEPRHPLEEPHYTVRNLFEYVELLTLLSRSR